MSSISPIISVVMPVYNGEKYLHETVDSILHQSFSNFEFIIVNDGSTDQSLEILENYAVQDKRIQIINRENYGVSVSRNEAIMQARGEYIAHIDADDVALLHRLERQLQWFEKTGADVCGSWIEVFDGISSSVWRFRENDTAIKFSLLFSNAFAQSAVMVRAIVAKENLYDEHMQYSEDYALWTRLAMTGYKMTNVPEVLLRYRLHTNQVSQEKWNALVDSGQRVREEYFAFYCSDAHQVDKQRFSRIVDPRLPVKYVDFSYSGGWFESITIGQNTPLSVAILDNWLYIARKAAGEGPKVYSRYKIVAKRLGIDITLRSNRSLYFLCLFRIRYQSNLYKYMKKLREMLVSILGKQ